MEIKFIKSPANKIETMKICDKLNRNILSTYYLFAVDDLECE